MNWWDLYEVVKWPLFMVVFPYAVYMGAYCGDFMRRCVLADSWHKHYGCAPPKFMEYQPPNWPNHP